MSKFQSEQLNMLIEAIIGIKDAETLRMFFEDICTIKELQDLTQRLQVAALLSEGRNYQEISRQTSVSSATISRVNRCLLYGDGGYRTVLDRIGNSEVENG